MKIEIEIQDRQLQDLARSAVDQLFNSNRYETNSGRGTNEIRNYVIEQATRIFKEMDISAMIRQEVESQARATMQSVIAEHLKAEARKALKEALKSQQDDRLL